MKKVLIICFVFLATAFTTSLLAQNSAASAARPRHRAMPGGERSMRGCVTKADDGSLFLVPQRGVKVRLNSSEEVAKRVGQQVRVSGAFVDAEDPPPASSAAGSAASNSADAKHRVVREFRVMKLDVLSQTCSAPSANKKK